MKAGGHEHGSFIFPGFVWESDRERDSCEMEGRMAIWGALALRATAADTERGRTKTPADHRGKILFLSFHLVFLPPDFSVSSALIGSRWNLVQTEMQSSMANMYTRETNVVLLSVWGTWSYSTYSIPLFLGT